jgi:hypothetical protein
MMILLFVELNLICCCSSSSFSFFFCNTPIAAQSYLVSVAGANAFASCAAAYCLMLLLLM